CCPPTATGAFYVTNKSGPGFYRLAPPSNVPLADVPYTATPIGALSHPINTFTGMTGRGITQTYTGDLLVVNNAANQVLHSAYGTPPLFATLSPLGTTNLNNPVGIAKAPSLRQILVSNSNSTTQSAVSIFDATGAPATTPCPAGLSLPNNNHEVPNYLATAPTDLFPTAAPHTVITDTIYLVTNANSNGTLWTWNYAAQGNCNLVAAATAKDPLSGVGVAPAPVTLTWPETGSIGNPVPTPFFFNASLFQFTATGCNATVTAYPRSLAT